MAKIKPAERQAEPARAADRIRQTAGELFYSRGIRAVGVDEIVERAGATKPSLYRSFGSKDELAAAYLTDYDARFWARFEAGAAQHPGDPRAQVLAILRGLAERATQAGYRGCGLTNAAVEYPEPDHPARAVALQNKRELRARLRAMAGEMGAAEPARLGDGLMLLVEGAYASGQMFGPGGPAGAVADAAEALMAALAPSRR
jgi:AcrR family transcriptional regulator